MYLKRYFLYSFTWFSLSVGPTVPTQKVFFVEFSLPINFDLLIRVAYGSGSLKIIQIRNTAVVCRWDRAVEVGNVITVRYVDGAVATLSL
jgi:hypothetical protein